MNDRKESKTKNFIVNAMIVVLVLSLSANVYQFTAFKEKKLEKYDMEMRYKKITSELRNAKAEITKFKGISNKLDKVVDEASIELSEKEKMIAELVKQKKITDTENQKLINEIDSIKNEYIDIIDSILIERRVTKTLNNQLDILNDKIFELNMKLGKAKLINSDNIVIQAFRKSGDKRTVIAKRTGKFKVCFDLLANNVTEKGKLEIYIRIISPEAKVLTEDAQNPKTFMHPDLKTQVEYTVMEMVNFENKKLNVCKNWEVPDTLSPGIYLVEIYTKENKLGIVTISLR